MAESCTKFLHTDPTCASLVEQLIYIANVKVNQCMRGLLIRVCIDSTCGPWNGPIDIATGRFVYVPIPESQPIHPKLRRTFDEVLSPLKPFQAALPRNLLGGAAHFDPDFAFLTYGDQGARAKRIRDVMGGDDRGFIAFYGGFRDVKSRTIVDAIIGIYHVAEVIDARAIPKNRWRENAHTRRRQNKGDVVVRAIRGKSGRLKKGIVIGQYRDRAHRVDKAILKEWGGLDVRDGYIQRSVWLPEFMNPDQFLKWLKAKRPQLIASNN